MHVALYKLAFASSQHRTMQQKSLYLFTRFVFKIFILFMNELTLSLVSL